MDIQEYIESGILELYCLGELHDEDEAYVIQMAMLYPEVKTALNEIELILEQWAQLNAVQPPEEMREMVLATLAPASTARQLDLDNLPPISHDADLQAWLNTFAHLIPDEPSEAIAFHPLRKDERFQQMLVISKVNVPEEEHGDYLESFFILKGTCECTVGGEDHVLAAGDFIEIPKYTPHDIRLTSPHVVAVLQYEFI